MHNVYRINPLKLRGLIAEKGYNITTFSDRIGITYNSICRILSGRFAPRYQTICDIASALEMTQDQIMEVFFNTTYVPLNNKR